MRYRPRRHRRWSIACLQAALLALLAGPATVAVQAPPPAATEAASLSVATFDRAWELVRDTHFDPEFNGVDWAAVRDELRPRAEAATDRSELRQVIREMLARLGQSHFVLLPQEAVDAMTPDPDEDEPEPEAEAGDTDEPIPAADETDRHDHAHEAAEADEAAGADDADAHDHADTTEDPADHHDPDTDDELDDLADLNGDDGTVGIEVRLADGSILVTRVEPGSPAAEAGVMTGWIVERIARRDVAELLELLPESTHRSAMAAGMMHNRLQGSPDSTVEVGFRDADDHPVSVRLQRTQESRELVKLGNLPPLPAGLSREWIDSGDDGTRLGLIRFNIWMTPIARSFDEAIDALRDADGIVIDLRGNPGGVGAMAMGIAGHFFDERNTMGTLITRQSELRFFTNPRFVDTAGRRVTPYAGPVAILVDELTGSTSEIFVGGMQALGRARVFGTTTAGAALPAMMDRLPNGDVLMHAFANYVNADGEELEGRGVIPDVPVPLTRESLLAHGDPVLSRAVEWLHAETTSTDDNR